MANNAQDEVIISNVTENKESNQRPYEHTTTIRVDSVENPSQVQQNAPLTLTDMNEENNTFGINPIKLPNDVYSLLFLVKIGSGELIFVALIFCTQITIQSVILKNMFEYPEGSPFLNAPVNVTRDVRLAQFIALAIAVITQGDLIDSLDILGISPPISIKVTCYRHYLSFAMRLIVGMIGLFISFLIVIQSNKTLDLFKDFVAMAFVNNLDNITFALAARGYVSGSLKELTTRVKEINFGEKSRKNIIYRRLALMISWLVIIVFWFLVAVQQSKGSYYSKTYTIEFNDEAELYYSAHGGIYKWNGDIDFSGRPIYTEKKNLEFQNEHGLFSIRYCRSYEKWLFSTSSDKMRTCPYDIIMMSPRTKDFDIGSISASDWSTWDGSPTGITKFINHDCIPEKYDEGENQSCSFLGKCDKTEKRCVCRNGYYGPRCENPPPCKEIAVWKGNTFEKASSNYSLVYEKNGTKEPLLIYGRPVYHSNDESGWNDDIVVYGGARWYLTSLKILEMDSLDELEPGLFKLLTFGGKYISQSTSSSTPVLIEWLEWITYLEDGDEDDVITTKENANVGVTQETDNQFLCSVCDEYHGCGENGVCGDSNKCVCKNEGEENGYTGVNCEIQLLKGTVTFSLNYGNGTCGTCVKPVDSSETLEPLIYSNEQNIGSSFQCNRIFYNITQSELIITHAHSLNTNTTEDCQNVEMFEEFLVIPRDSKGQMSQVQYTTTISDENYTILKGNLPDGSCIKMSQVENCETYEALINSGNIEKLWMYFDLNLMGNNLV